MVLFGCGSSASSIAPSSSVALIPQPSPPSEYPNVGRIEDPPLEIILPVGWRPYPIPTFRLVTASTANQATGTTKRILEGLLADIDSGRVRLVGSGPSGVDPWSGTMIVLINRGDASLADAVTRIEKLTEGVAHTEVERRDAQLEVGQAVRISSVYPVPPDARAGSTASHVINYVIRLEDGQTMWVNATAPQAAKGFDVLVDQSVESLRRR
jgi:hypothetical protein